MRQILLITLGFSTALFASFSINGNIVTDSTTGLQWQDDGTPSYMKWTAAIDYCENLTLDTYSDWRLPNLKELTSIVDDTKVSPSLDTSVFLETVYGSYWSSTTPARDIYVAWLVDFDDGDQHYADLFKTDSFSVRCVRAGQ